MDHAQTGELLARIQVHDNRQIGLVTIEEWQHELKDTSYADALEAVREHRRTSTEYLTASHVLAGVKRIRDGRLVGIDEYRAAFPGDPDDARAELAWWRGAIKSVADGTPPDDVFTMPVLEARPLQQLEAAAGATFRRVPRR